MITSESVPVMAQKGSYKVEAAKAYWWCACEQGSKQSFRDGSHKGLP